MRKVKMIGTCVAGLLMSALAMLPSEPTKPGEMRLSTEGYEILLNLESCRLKPYQCSANRWTNGVGNTENVDPNKEITEEQAAIQLKKNVAKFETAVNNQLDEEIPQPIFDAMVIFSFNIGIGGFESSTALKNLKAGEFSEACRWILPWNKITVIENGVAKKVVSEGLKNRRFQEYTLCMKGVTE